MRTYQFLWQIRYYKSRSLSTNAFKKGIINFNNNIVKTSKEIRIREIFEIKKNKEGI